jgi:hypothetical protein
MLCGLQVRAVTEDTRSKEDAHKGCPGAEHCVLRETVQQLRDELASSERCVDLLCGVSPFAR